MSDTVSNYLRDLGREIVALVSHTSDDVAFELGRRTALYEVVTLMTNQAVAFGLTNEDVGLWASTQRGTCWVAHSRSAPARIGEAVDVD